MKPVKAVFLGSAGVGKTSIARRLVHDLFDEHYRPTLGALSELWTFIVPALEREFYVNLWDTAGQETFHSLTQVYVRDAAIVFLVYDVTSLESFTALESLWLKMLDGVRGNPHFIVLANKFDLPDHAVGDTDCRQLVSRIQAKAGFGTSAKTGLGLSEIPPAVAQCIGGPVAIENATAPPQLGEVPGRCEGQSC
jgi:small GTP-binding protein